MRTFALLNLSGETETGKNIIERLPEGSKILVFMPEKHKNGAIADKIAESAGNRSVEMRFFDDDLVNHVSKLRNFVSKTLIDEKIGGFVHILDESVKIIGNPDRFLDEIEKMMVMLNQKTWFDTSCDGCNFVYSKYNPRLHIAIDDDVVEQKYSKRIAWCSNANTVWVCFNMDIAGYEDLRLEEKFDYAMYYIIEFLARRRNTKKPGELYYMNYYPSIPDELGVFTTIEIPEMRHFSDAEIQSEGKLFEEMNINHTPDQSIDVLMEDMRTEILKH